MYARQTLVAGLSLFWAATASVLPPSNVSGAEEKPGSVDRLIEALETAPQPEVRWRAAQRLGAIEASSARIAEYPKSTAKLPTA